MSSRKVEGSGKEVAYNKGAWTIEEDAKLAQYIELHGPMYIELHGPMKWKTLEIKSGLNRCGKSCRLRWLNYLRPNIKRGNISSEEEDLILRLHKLLGNRWSLIAGRIPGRTDNEIKNYWNSHLSKKTNQQEIHVTTSSKEDHKVPYTKSNAAVVEEECVYWDIGDTSINFDVDEVFNFSTEGTYGLDWVTKFLELDDIDLVFDQSLIRRIMLNK